MSGKNNQYQVRGRIWISIGDKTIIGEGRANLLRKTSELGSLRKASLELGLSYRQAWYSLNQMNKATETPVISLQRGGKNGGIARITEFGKEILSVFEKSRHEFEIFLINQSAILKTRT